MKRLNENGFSAVEIVLIIAVIGLVGVSGWLFVDRQKDKPSDSTTSSQPENNKSTESTTKTPGPTFNPLPNGWVEYKNNEKGFRFGYPGEWGTLKGSPLSTDDYKDDSKNLQGRVIAEVSAKANYSVIASKYGATVKPSSDGKVWVVSEENPAAVDGYKVGDTYKTKDIKVNGGTVIDLTIRDEDCTLPRYLLTLKDSYVLVSIPELCPANFVAISSANQNAYTKLTADFISSLTVY
jgi:hypothetical protein